MNRESGPDQQLPVQFGKYTLVDRIAQGGMAEIFKAKSYGVGGFEKTIVIKRILPSIADDQDFVGMLIDEAKLCAILQHANIVQTFDLGRLDGRYFIAMEYVEGVDLVQLLSRLRKARTLLPMELACYIMSQALKGLDFAHRATGPEGEPLHIVHRDFNPSNILLSYLGEIKVADFGIAKATDRSTKTVSGGLKGKMGYLSPEQVVGADLDLRSDIFTAGITMWEMLATRRMFGSGTELDILLAIRDAKIPDLLQHNPGTPPELLELVMQALKKDPSERFATAGEFKEALDDFLFERGIKVGASHLEAYLKHLFSDVIEQARQRARNQKDAATRSRPPTYWVRMPGESPRGPLSFEELSDMTSSGQLDTRCQVMREGGTWCPFRELPELATLLSNESLDEDTDPSAVPAYQGLIAEVSFPKLFYRLAIAKQDGRLVLERHRIKKEIFMRHGLPEFVKSSVLDERLGEFLVRTRTITQVQRDEAVKVMKGYAGRLGDTLIGLGILRPNELFEKLTEQVREKVLEVFGWTMGTYRFFLGQTYKGEVVPLKIGGFALIAAGVRKYTPIENLKDRYRSRLSLRIERMDNPYLSLGVLALQPREQRVVDLIDGRAKMQDLLARGGSDQGDFQKAVFRTVYLLEELELARLVP